VTKLDYRIVKTNVKIHFLDPDEINKTSMWSWSNQQWTS